MCGETPPPASLCARVRGRSPRVRGNRSHGGSPAGFARSIPACAGKPHRLRAPCRSVGVDPRVCGETKSSQVGVTESAGRSPRVRGNPSSCRGIFPSSRSIPACAGKPQAETGYPRDRAVDPRVCGETFDYVKDPERAKGRSPRVRGNQLGLGQHQLGLRSIPACAGKPFPGSQPRCAHKVDPRVCGETIAVIYIRKLEEGRSPRVRGNQVSEIFTR